jgi:uncharacterized protein involved in outer membrane biogenesis
MSRRLQLTLLAVVCLLGLGGAFLWALPEIVRRVALAQIPKHTGRAAAIEDIDLNLFTGHLAIKNFRLADREGPEPFVAFERLDLRLGLLALLRSHLRIVEITLAAPSVRIVRTAAAQFNFSDLLAGRNEPERPPPEGGSPWVVTVERLTVTRGRALADDRAAAPPAAWTIQDLGIEAAGLSTRPGAPPGRLIAQAKLDEAALALRADPLRIDPLQVNGRLTFDGFEMRRLNPYVYIPMGTPYLPRGGRLTLALTAHLESEGEEVRKAVVAGTVSVDGEALAQVGHTDPFLSVNRLGVEIKEVDAIERHLTVASIVLEGLDLTARRDAQGVIDLLAMFQPKPAAAPAGGKAPPTDKDKAAPPGSPPPRRLFPIIQTLARGFEQIRIERITLEPSAVRFIDESVKPTTTLALSKLQARIDDLTWPVLGPAQVAISTGMPGGGTLDMKGPVVVQPLDVTLTTVLRDAPITPYQAYIPVPAQLGGRYNGDSVNHIALNNGKLVATSKGNSWAQDVEIRAPGAKQPAISVERMELVGIDFDWPNRAGFARAGFRRPRVEIERAADGSINLRQLFTPVEDNGRPAPSQPAPEPSPPERTASSEPKPRGLMETMRLDFREVRVEEGFIRFLDRTTSPAFSQDMSRLNVGLTGFGNQPGRRAKLAVDSVVGGDAALDVRGEIGPLGAPPFVDLVGELRSYQLPSVDPYSAAAIGWVIKKGELQYKVRFKLEGDQLTAENDVVVGKLQVAPAAGTDEVKQRIGLPLGLIVALVKDQQGDIKATVPVTGTVNDPKFDLRDTIWTAVKNVLINIATAPFKAIGRLFSGAEKLEVPKVDPVTFAAGSSVLSPAMEEHLLRVADFLRRSPFVNLALSSAPSPADVEALRSDAMMARLRDFQKARGLDDTEATLAAYYAEHLPDVSRPETVGEQLALLREREPAPDALLTDLGQRRLQATRERLQEAEGIPPARLVVDDAGAPPAAPAAVPEGRIEFGIVAGG